MNSIPTLGIALVLVSGGLCGAPPSLEVQEMRLTLDQVAYQLRGHQVERDLFLERIEKLEKLTEKLGQQLRQNSQDRSLEGRLTQLEKNYELLVLDCKTLKTHLNETHEQLATCHTKLSQIDKQLAIEIKGLKQSLECMVTLLKTDHGTADGNAYYYVVKSGDSLGKIAMRHHTDIRTLKQMNALSSDTIYMGQKLAVPEPSQP